MGYVPERPTLYEWMTVEEIGWFTAGFYGERFLPEYRRLVAQFGLPGRRKIKSLSKGMRAKVALSLAMAHDPDLLVLDEPTSGLDALVRREFLESMVDRAATGKTVFLSSHQIAEVERVADIVAILHRGKLVLVERLDDLKAAGPRGELHDDQRGRRIAAPAGRDTLPPPDGPGSGRSCCARRPTIAWPRSAATPGIENVEARVPSLEEIFIAYMQQGRETGRRPSCRGRRRSHERHDLLADVLEGIPRTAGLLDFHGCVDALGGIGLACVVLGSRSDSGFHFFLRGLVFPAVYALASGATLFATERENETYDIMRAFP